MLCFPHQRAIGLFWLVAGSLLVHGVIGQGGGGGGGGGGGFGGFGGYGGSGSGGGATLGTTDYIIFGSIVGGIVVILGIVFLCCFCSSKCQTSHSSFRKNYLQKLKKDKISEQEFDDHANQFHETLDGVKSENNKFSYTQLFSNREVQIRSVEMKKVESFNFEVVLKGYDSFGRWEGEGNFIMTEGGPFFWMLKVYDDRVRAGQTGDWHNLLYESRVIEPGKIKGEWFYEEYKGNIQYSGQWCISHKRNRRNVIS